jgi:hypothetical protein
MSTGDKQVVALVVGQHTESDIISRTVVSVAAMQAEIDALRAEAVRLKAAMGRAYVNLCCGLVWCCDISGREVSEEALDRASKAACEKMTSHQNIVARLTTALAAAEAKCSRYADLAQQWTDKADAEGRRAEDAEAERDRLRVLVQAVANAKRECVRAECGNAGRPDHYDRMNAADAVFEATVSMCVEEAKRWEK